MTAYTPRGKNFALVLLAMTQFVVVIDASIVNVALPSIGQALHFARTDLSWVVNAYALAFGGFLLLGGRMADLLGRRRMFMVGLVVFSFASLAGGLAQSDGWLIATRARPSNEPSSSRLRKSLPWATSGGRERPYCTNTSTSWRAAASMSHQETRRANG